MHVPRARAASGESPARQDKANDADVFTLGKGSVRVCRRYPGVPGPPEALRFEDGTIKWLKSRPWFSTINLKP